MRQQFLWVCIALMSYSSLLSAQKVKEVKAFRTEAGSSERILQLHQRYDKNGNVLYSHQPDLYCTMEYTYDAQNRLLSAYQMCGESFWNGKLIYSYPTPYLIVVSGEQMVGGRYLRRDSLNAQQKITASWSYWSSLDLTGDSTVTHVRYTYSPKGLLTRTHTHITTYSKENPRQPDSQTDDFEEFEYNNRDSLTAKYVYTGNNTAERRMVYQAQFDSLTGKIIESFEQPHTEGGITRKEYTYDEKGRLSHFKNWYLPSEDAAWELTREVLYRYPNDAERVEVWRSYYQNTFDTEEVRTFQNNLPMRITTLDAKGQGQQVVVYEYTYYK